MSTCSECELDDRRKCTNCAPGLSLVDGKCEDCPEGCAQCNNGKCALCLDKYTPN